MRQKGRRREEEGTREEASVELLRGRARERASEMIALKTVGARESTNMERSLARSERTRKQRALQSRSLEGELIFCRGTN